MKKQRILSSIMILILIFIAAKITLAATLTFDSSPVSGAYITIYQPAQDLDGKGSGYGPITLRYNTGTLVEFGVSTSYNNGNFINWTMDGGDYYSERRTIFTVDSSNHSFVAHYTAPPPSMPDFLVTSIVLDPASPITGSTFKANVFVQNQGTGSGNAGYLTVWLDQPSSKLCSTNGDWTEFVDVLGAGESKTVTFTLQAGSMGTKTFRAVVDSNCQTAESDNNNNESTLQYTVLPIQKADFTVDSIMLDPGQPTAGSTFKATVTVKNQGEVSGDGGRLSLWSDQSSNQGCGNSGEQFGNVGLLAPGQSSPFTFTGFSAGSAGQKTFRAFVDSLCQTTEVTEDNNQLTKGYTVVDSPKPDFVVASIVINPSSPTTSFTAEVTVKNQGTASGNGGRMDVWRNQPSGQSCGATGDQYENVGMLTVGESKKFLFTFWTDSVGSKTFRAFVDSGCVTSDGDKNNNQLTKELKSCTFKG